MKAYIAGPLFNDAEKAFNLKVDALIQSLGIESYLPQRDGGESIRMIRQGQPHEETTESYCSFLQSRYFAAPPSIFFH